MKTRFNLDIAGTPSGVKHVYVDVDLPFAPFVGMEIEQPAWKEPRPVKRVVLSLSEKEPSVHVYFAPHQLERGQAVADQVKMYVGHGWTAI